MLRSLTIRNFTVFEEADLRFVRGLNVILRGNATGKTHLLKLPYAVMPTSPDERQKGSEWPAEADQRIHVAKTIAGIGRPEDRLCRFQPGTRARAPGRLLFRHASMLEQSQ